MNLINMLINDKMALKYTPVCLLHSILLILHVTMLTLLALTDIIIQSYENINILLKTL